MAGGGGVYVGSGAVVVMDSPSVAYAKICAPRSGVDRNMKERANRVAMVARSIAPIGETGALRAGIRASQNREANGRFSFAYSVSTSASYGFYVHEGTGPSPRWAQRAKVMHWRDLDGRNVFRSFVMHPGTPAQPFLQDALVAMAG